MNIEKVSIPGVKRIIGVISGKGGTGKTFVASNLALTLAKNGKRTGLLDADIACPNIFKMLSITANLTPTEDNKIIPVEKWGTKIVSMAGLCKTEDEPIVWRGPILTKILQKLLRETIWGELDVLVIDFPTGSSDIALTILQNFAIDGIIVVSTSQEIATLDARRVINMAQLIRTPVIGMIENMRGDIFGEGGVSRVAQMYRVPFLGSIPLRKQIVALCDAGTPTVFHMEEIEMIFSKIAKSLTPVNA